MQLPHLAILLSALASLGRTTAAAAASREPLCGNLPPSEDTLQQLRLLREAEEDAGTVRSFGAASQEETLTINLYMHGVVDPGQDPKTLTEAGMQAQLTTLNTAYAPSSIQFHLAGVDFASSSASLAHYVPMEDWDSARVDYLRSSRGGGYQDLNLWFYSSMQAPAVGVCYGPDRARRANASDWFHDGCHLLAATMPGGDCDGCSGGWTAVHETGHWFGLLHPWGHAEGDCTGSGDEISDTPAQAKAVFGCPDPPQDSCPDQEGVDSADNYMDYASSSCFASKKFTAGQSARMHDNYDIFRAP